MTQIIRNCTCSNLTHDLTKANDAIDGGCFGVKKKHYVIAIIAVVLVLALCLSAVNPVAICGIDVPDNYRNAIAEQAKGLYSTKIPLVPICVSVDAFSDGRVYYTIHYFPFGSVGMSYAENDGYNIEKPLTGL